MVRVFRWSVIAVCLGWAGTADAGDCKARTKLMKQRLDAVPSYTQLVASPAKIRLPVVSRSVSVERAGITIDVLGDQVFFQGKTFPVSDIAAVQSSFEAIERVEKLTGSTGNPVYLRLDAEQPLQAALPMMCRLGGARDLFVLVDDRTADAKPYEPPAAPASLHRLLEHVAGLTSAVEKSQILAGAFTQAVGKCDALREGFDELVNVPAVQRPLAMRSVIPERLRKCDCKGADVEALEALALRILAPTVPPSRAVALPLKCGGGTPSILRFSKDATAQALAEVLVKQKQGHVRIELAR